MQQSFIGGKERYDAIFHFRRSPYGSAGRQSRYGGNPSHAPTGPYSPQTPYQGYQPPKKPRRRTVLAIIFSVLASILVPLLAVATPFLLYFGIFYFENLWVEMRIPKVARSAEVRALYPDCLQDVEPGALGGKALDGRGKPVIRSYEIETSRQYRIATPISIRYRLIVNGDPDMFVVVSVKNGLTHRGDKDRPVTCSAWAYQSQKLTKALQKHYGDCINQYTPHDGEPLCVIKRDDGNLEGHLRECEDGTMGSLSCDVPKKELWEE